MFDPFLRRTEIKRIEQPHIQKRVIALHSRADYENYDSFALNFVFSCESSSRSANVRPYVCLSVRPSVSISFQCLKTHVMKVRYTSVIHH